MTERDKLWLYLSSIDLEQYQYNFVRVIRTIEVVIE